MFYRRLRIFDIRHRCAWRKLISLLSFLLFVNTVINWTLVDDIGSSFTQSHHKRTGLKTRHGETMSFHDRVISINKWFDEDDEQDDEEKDLGFDGRGARGRISKRDSDDEPLIIYITRKPSNRRPLGETPGKSEGPVIHTDRTESPSTNKSKPSSSLLSKTQHVSVFGRKIGDSRNNIGMTREKIMNRKREMIRNRSIDTREIALPFLQKHRTKLRSIPTNESDKRRLLSRIRSFESKVNCSVIDIYSNETIRYYSRPGWFKVADISSMNLLSGSWILRGRPAQHEAYDAMAGEDNAIILISNPEFERLANDMDDDNRGKGRSIDSDFECNERGESSSPACRAAWCSVDLGLVVAFHLDRVIGLNITPPTVARELPVEKRHPTAGHRVSHRNKTQAGRSSLDDPLGGNVQVQTVSLIVTSSIGSDSSHDSWRPRTLDRTALSPGSGSDGHVSDAAQKKFYIFCFVLKIKNCAINRWKDNFNVVGRHLRSSGAQVSHLPCQDSCNDSHSLIQLFSSPSLFYEEENQILQKLSSLSSRSLPLLQAGKIRQRLLQSLFVDRVFWAEAGGRRGIEDLLNVIDSRIKELAEWMTIFSHSDKLQI